MASAAAPPAEDRFSRSLRNLFIGGAVLVLLALTWLLGVTVIPRWWAQRVGNRVDGSLTAGSVMGVMVGAVFTALPLLVIWLGIRYRRSWKRAIGVLLVALLLASPNLATLGIVFGNGNAAHAGERILDVDGPGFRGGSLVGAVLAVIVLAFVGYLALSRGRFRRRSDRYENELRARDRPPDEA